MLETLFGLNCPQCGTALEVDHTGRGSCPGCGQLYLSRFGHLLALDDTLMFQVPAATSGSVSRTTEH